MDTTEKQNNSKAFWQSVIPGGITMEQINAMEPDEKAAIEAMHDKSTDSEENGRNNSKKIKFIQNSTQ